MVDQALPTVQGPPSASPQPTDANTTVVLPAAPQGGGVPTAAPSAAPQPAPASAPAQTPPPQQPETGQVSASVPPVSVPPRQGAQPTPQAAQTTQPATAQAVPTGEVKPVAQSEETPAPAGAETNTPSAAPRSIIDPRPYAILAEKYPQLRAVVDAAAGAEGVSPSRLAAHMYYENGFKFENAPTSSAGAVGPMQVLPATAKQIDPQGKLDVNNPYDNVQLGARYIRMGDDNYGKDTRASVAFYHGGPGSVDDIAAHPDQAYQRHPATMSYVDKITPGFSGGQDITGHTGSTVTPQGLVQAGTQGGPNGFLQYIASSSPDSMTMTDKWQHAEALGVRYFLMKGDVVGAQHMRDFVLQMSHNGSNQALMQAYQSLNNGDTMTAAQQLAKAHAFFPDGTMGRFGVDQKGQLWGERLDEHDPTKAFGQPFQVTPQGVAGMLNQTTDPRQYLETLLQQQKSAADIRHQDQMGAYYSGLLQNHVDTANIRADASTNNAETRANATITAADIRSQARAGMGPGAAVVRDANKEATSLYGSDADPNTPLQTRAKMAAVHVDARQMGADPITAEQVARGVTAGSLKVQRMSDGNYGVVDPKNPGAPVALLSPSLVQRLAGGHAPQGQQGGGGAPQMGRPGGGAIPTTPIGAGAASPYAMGSGVQQNLTGTVNSSAIPTQPGQ